MIVVNGLDRIEGRLRAVASIGNYDGVHLGHRAILASLQAAARRAQVPSLLVTFDPHPAAVVAPERRPPLLQTRRQKLDALEETGLDLVLVVTFDPALAALDPEQFLERLAHAGVDLHAVHVGRGFRFGRARAGDLARLAEIGARRGFGVVGIPEVRHDGEIVSSSAIRRRLAEGDVETARQMLGRPYALAGEVVRGEGRGARLQFPTANLRVENELIPRGGVYVTETVALGRRHGSITNIGHRPTFGGSALTVESHLLDFEADLYGARLEVRFLQRLRDERRFAGPDELVRQIERDRAQALAVLQSGS